MDVTTALVNNVTTSPPPSSDEIFQNLYPAIVQAFVIILSGYIAGRTGMITQAQSKGIGTFVTMFALPALLFKSMVELNFNNVNWKFLGSVCLSKAIVFFVVLLFSLLLIRPVNLGKAALGAMFSTQSNDFALGYPIVQAIYQKTHPDFLMYIYLLAPVSLVILNPIGFLLLEIEKRRSDQTKVEKWRLVWHVFKGIICNPIVFMVVIGIAGNFIFHQKVPAILTDILKVLSDSFGATALFYLGLNLVGKFQKIKGLALIMPALLIAAKTLLLPFLTREIVYAFNTGRNANETLAYSMYGFLYGTFPSAPTVLLYANQYGIATDIVSTGMVLCTFLSAPLMFVSAKMITLQNIKETENISVLSETGFDISILSIMCAVWVLSVFVLGRKWRTFPHQFTIYLILAQIMTCLGMIFWHAFDNTVAWQHYLQFIVFFVGVNASRTWTSMVAVGLCLLRVRSLCFVLRMRVWIILYGCCVPILCTGLLLITSGGIGWTTSGPSFQYGPSQLIVSTCVLALSLIISVVALIYQQRNDRHHTEYTAIADKDCEDIQKEPDRDGNNYGACCNGKTSTQSEDEDNSLDNTCDKISGKNIEDLVPWDAKEASRALNKQEENGTLSEKQCLVGTCSAKQRKECKTILRDYLSVNGTGSEADAVIQQQVEDEQYGHHIVLMFLLVVSMGIGLFLCVWKLMHEDLSGAFVELEFLDVFFNFGQAFFVFAVFGLDTKLIIIPCVKRWRRLIYGAENIHLPRVEDLDEDTRHVCDQFNMYHKDKCKEALVKDKRHRIRLYKSVFTGTELVAWLLEVGLASDNTEAVIYGQQLVLGRIIHHVSDEHQFYDLPYFYRFLDSEV